MFENLHSGFLRKWFGCRQVQAFTPPPEVIEDNYEDT